MVMDSGLRQERLELADQTQRSLVIIDCAGVDDFPADLSCIFDLFYINKPHEDLKVILELFAMAGSVLLVFNDRGNLLGRIVSQSIEEV
jgi:hypothetical protein